ncbi:hypothetical protein LTR06_011283 [Exophiala xenobiotica]|nr:hypothetical protein LTR06_011283 [Exophiala xenobiotica]
MIYEGETELVTDLIKSGGASTSDVDPYGLGVAYYAAYYCRKNRGLPKAMEILQRLVELGARLEDEDEIGRPMNEEKRNIGEYLCRIALLATEDANALLHQYLEKQGFGQVHRALLGIDLEFESLEAYLSHPTVDLADIDKKESRGRSALAWATEYGFAEAAQQLILCGANPRQSRPSSQGELPLLHLAIAGSSRIDPQHNSLTVIGVLLRAGADPNGVDHEGWTPLHVAASWKNHLAIRELQRVAHVEY